MSLPHLPFSSHDSVTIEFDVDGDFPPRPATAAERRQALQNAAVDLSRLAGRFRRLAEESQLETSAANTENHCSSLLRDTAWDCHYLFPMKLFEAENAPEPFRVCGRAVQHAERLIQDIAIRRQADGSGASRSDARELIDAADVLESAAARLTQHLEGEPDANLK